jgi:tetratricopeptide (TPR) repeat protein
MIRANQEALSKINPAAEPLAYARIQYELGNLYTDLAQIEALTVNLGLARESYTAALQYCPPELSLVDYVLIQNSLGNLYIMLSEIEARLENLQKAVHAFEAALLEINPQTSGGVYAAAQINRGHIYTLLAEIQDPDHYLDLALSAYGQALPYCQPGQVAYATLQFGLGNVCRQLTQDRPQNLQRALTAYHEALQIYTPLETPMPYAMTQGNLGLVYQALNDLPAAITCWKEAVGILISFGAKDEALVYLQHIAAAESG